MELAEAAKSFGTGREALGFHPKGAAEVREARKTYESMKSGAASDDIMPEIYLYTVVQNYSMYDEMKQLVKIMQAKQPHSEVVKDLDAWVENRRPK